VDWQLILVGLLISLAFLYLSRESWRSWAGRKSGCAGGCHCGSKAKAGEKGQITWITPDQLSARLRPHSRPE